MDGPATRTEKKGREDAKNYRGVYSQKHARLAAAAAEKTATARATTETVAAAAEKKKK